MLFCIFVKEKNSFMLRNEILKDLFVCFLSISLNVDIVNLFKWKNKKKLEY